VSWTSIRSEPVGQDVQTPPCLIQKEHEQARAGISVGSGCQSSWKEMLPQWQLPRMSMVRAPRVFATPNVGVEAGPTAEGQAREAHHAPRAHRGLGLLPLGLASNDGLGVARFRVTVGVVFDLSRYRPHVRRDFNLPLLGSIHDTRAEPIMKYFVLGRVHGTLVAGRFGSRF
jgi:hypothetical protein